MTITTALTNTKIEIWALSEHLCGFLWSGDFCGSVIDCGVFGRYQLGGNYAVS